MPPPTPAELSYATPTRVMSPLRKKAVKHCRGNGIGCIFLGLLVSASLLVLLGPTASGVPRADIALVLLITLGYGAVFLGSGIIHLMASFKLRTPNPQWEMIVRTTAYIHIACIVLWIAVLVWASTRTGSFNVIPFVIAVAIAISLAQGVQKVQAASNEIG